MNTSTHSFLSEILNGENIPIGKLAYFRGRLSNRIHELVLTEFARLSKAGLINKAQLAERIGRKPEQVTRWLGTPSNWTLETVSDLLLAMGLEPRIAVVQLADAGKMSVSVNHTITEIFSLDTKGTEIQVTHKNFTSSVSQVHG